jgi:hypothetical protein
LSVKALNKLLKLINEIKTKLNTQTDETTNYQNIFIHFDFLMKTFKIPFFVLYFEFFSYKAAKICCKVAQSIKMNKKIKI